MRRIVKEFRVVNQNVIARELFILESWALSVPQWDFQSDIDKKN